MSEAAVDLQEKKISTVFRWWDHNGDGYITKDDMDHMLHLWVSLPDENDTKNRDTLAAGMEHWEQLLLDGREDKTNDKISKEEFIRIMRNIAEHPENFEKTVISVTDGILRAFDRDGNDKLSLEEYTNLYNKLHIPGSHAPEAFKRLDRDNSGELTRQEIIDAVYELYLSPDPDAPGNWILGPPDAS